MTIDKNNINTICKANKNKNSIIPCGRNTNGFDFCYYHRKQNQNSKLIKSIEELDKHYKHCLLYIMDSWNEVNKWDINIIINHYTTQLNSSNMENPFPIYPSDPFTRTPITKEDIQNIIKKIKQISLNVNLTLKIFLLSKKTDLFYNEAIISQTGHSSSLLELFDTKMRYKLINNKDSQELYTGYWIQKSAKLSTFEKLYNLIKKIPIYLIDLNNFIYDNPEINKIKKKMDELDEQINMPIVSI